MVSDWEAPRTNVATLAPPWWRLLGFDAKYFQVRWNNDCWGWPPFDGPDVVGWFSASACERRLYRVSCCWQVYWNWEISWVTVFPCYDQCLNCTKKSGLRNRVGKTHQIIIQKAPNELLRESHEMASEWIVLQIWGALCCPSWWGQTSRSMESKPRDTAFNNVDW